MLLQQPGGIPTCPYFHSMNVIGSRNIYFSSLFLTASLDGWKYFLALKLCIKEEERKCHRGIFENFMIHDPSSYFNPIAKSVLH